MRHWVLFCVATAAAATLGGGRAGAAGFDHPDHGTVALTRGGAFVALADDPSAILYNPAGAARLPGTQIWLGGNILMEDVRFQRRIYPIAGAPASANPLPDMYPHDQTLRMPEVHNSDSPFITPLLGITSDLEVLRPYNLVLMVGVYGPHVAPGRTFPRYCKPGVSPCEPVEQKTDAPGPQRYDVVEQDVLVIYPTVGLAWRPIPCLSIGGVFQPTYSSLDFSNVVAALGTLGQPRELPDYDVDITLNMKDVFTPTGIIGVHWAPLSFLEVGTSVRIGYTINFSGTVNMTIPDNLKGAFAVDPDPGSVSLDLKMPWVVRSGVRYVNRDSRERERFDVELDFVWESTGQVDNFDIQTDVQIVTPIKKPIEGLTQDYYWSNIWSLRLGATYRLHELFKDSTMYFSLGTFYEASGVKDEYVRLGFTPLDRIGLSFGVGLRWNRFTLQVGYAHIFHPRRDVAPDGHDARTGLCQSSGGTEGCGSDVRLILPLNPESATPVGNGVYSIGIDIVTLGLKATFGG